jgi:hypothetical protein
VASAARPNGSRSVQSLVADQRDVGLEELARKAADGEKDATEVVSRIVDSRNGPSDVPAMMFDSAI